MTASTTETDATGRTLRIRLSGADDDVQQDIADVAARLDAGEDVEPRDPVLRVESLATVGRILRETNLELLEVIAAHEPESIRATARLVDRGPKEVMQNLNELEDYGLIAFEESGRSKRPLLPYDVIDIQFPLPVSRAFGDDQPREADAD